MTTADGSSAAEGLEALRRLEATDPVQFVSPSPDLSRAARSASEYLFSSLLPFCPKCPFDRLLVDGFDAEQIWQQIDLQTQPLIRKLRRDLKEFEQNPRGLSKSFARLTEARGVVEENGGEVRNVEERKENINGSDTVEEGSEEEAEEELGDEDHSFEGSEEEEGEENDEEEDDDEAEVVAGAGVDDQFFKTKELEEFLVKDEQKEYGQGEDGDDEDEDAEGDAEMEDGDDGDGVNDNIRYEDFFGGKKKNTRQKKNDQSSESEGIDKEDDEEEESENLSQKHSSGHLSTHEKELEKIDAKIAQMEKANLEPKAWTMQGEVTAAKRPKNSALEVDLDFEHNARPAPVITEEVTASLEEIIKRRIQEGHFDDVQKPPSLPSKPLKELKELDENKSKKGLGEIYGEEYAQETGLASAPMSFSDEQKQEATVLFKELCLKLDALSHFHFAPKPVIEDMSIQSNVPALAMEEVAPMAVSDAAMLAPEEVFTGKGDIKEEAELTQSERKRRRANKKRKFKAETLRRTAAKKARESSTPNRPSGMKES